ncbi:MAG: DUF1499 domain-containing protein [Bauldia sp.]
MAPPHRRRSPRAATTSALAALVALALFFAAAEAHRLEAIGSLTMALLVALAVAGALAAVALAVLAFLAIWREKRGGAKRAAVGLFGGTAVLAVPMAFAGWAMTIPAVPDIATDWNEPVPLRFGGFEPAAASAAAPATRQTAAYPDIAPRRYRADVPAVFAAVRRIVAANGWQVLDLALPVGRGSPAWLEAVARHSLLALRDEVAIRVTAEGEGARVDVRSAARFGAHDFGSNALRVRTLLADLDRALAAPSR